MSNIVKLIIEIDDEDYNSILKTYSLLGDRASSRMDNKLFRAIKNGTILNEYKVEDNQTWVVNDKGEKIAFKDISENKVQELLKVFAQSECRTENLCDSCTNKACVFQSGILRSKCDFYIAPIPHLEPDNCGNYVVQQETIPVKLKITEVKEHKSDFSDLDAEKPTIIDWNNCHTDEQLKKALSEALVIIHKYEKIEQILKDIPYGGEATLRRIQEVVENSESDFSDLDNCYEECPSCSLADGECCCLK